MTFCNGDLPAYSTRRGFLVVNSDPRKAIYVVIQCWSKETLLQYKANHWTPNINYFHKTGQLWRWSEFKPTSTGNINLLFWKWKKEIYINYAELRFFWPALYIRAWVPCMCSPHGPSISRWRLIKVLVRYSVNLIHLICDVCNSSNQSFPQLVPFLTEYIHYTQHLLLFIVRKHLFVK